MFDEPRKQSRGRDSQEGGTVNSQAEEENMSTEVDYLYVARIKRENIDIPCQNRKTTSPFSRKVFLEKGILSTVGV